MQHSCAEYLPHCLSDLWSRPSCFFLCSLVFTRSRYTGSNTYIILDSDCQSIITGVSVVVQLNLFGCACRAEVCRIILIPISCFSA